MTTVIIGAGGHAREVLDLLRELRIEPEGFLVEPGFGDVGTTIHGAPILGSLEWLKRRDDVRAVCAVGDPALRRRLTEQALDLGAAFITAIHPTVAKTEWVTIGKGAVVAAGTILTNEVRIGNHAHVNIACTLSHDTTIEDFATLSPGVHLAGGATVEEGAFLGVGAVVLPRVTVGSWAVVGAGAVVTRDMPPNATAVGVPARVTKTRESGWQLEA